MFGQGECPHCGEYIGRAYTGLTGSLKPDVDDLCVCDNCAKVSFFDHDGFRFPTPEEQRDLDADPQVQQARVVAASAILAAKFNRR